jgi:hypothetical protein
MTRRRMPHAQEELESGETGRHARRTRPRDGKKNRQLEAAPNVGALRLPEVERSAVLKEAVDAAFEIDDQDVQARALAELARLSPSLPGWSQTRQASSMTTVVRPYLRRSRPGARPDCMAGLTQALDSALGK